jgi:transcriptional regulator with XRE-family HTH domain
VHTKKNKKMRAKKGTIMQHVDLEQTRRSLGMSLKTVAEGMGVSRSTIRKWEQDNAMPSIEKREILAEIYHLDPETIKLLDTDKTRRQIESGLRKLRKEKGLTIRQVADELDTTTSQISKWETVPCTGINSTNAIKLGKLYDVPGYRIEELMKKYQNDLETYERSTKNETKEK